MSVEFSGQTTRSGRGSLPARTSCASSWCIGVVAQDDGRLVAEEVHAPAGHVALNDTDPSRSCPRRRAGAQLDPSPVRLSRRRACRQSPLPSSPGCQPDDQSASRVPLKATMKVTNGAPARAANWVIEGLALAEREAHPREAAERDPAAQPLLHDPQAAPHTGHRRSRSPAPRRSTEPARTGPPRPRRRTRRRSRSGAARSSAGMQKGEGPAVPDPGRPARPGAVQRDGEQGDAEGRAEPPPGGREGEEQQQAAGRGDGDTAQRAGDPLRNGHRSGRRGRRIHCHGTDLSL